ncbi:MAG: SDR family oxidoreductase [Pseudomonadales bacterium]|nr:SDR family oxidoreductase [Pseudomonadales bacterium]
MSERPYLLITGAAGALTQQVIRRLRRDYRLVVCDARREVSMPADIPSFHIDFNKRHFEDLFRQYPFSGIIHLGRIGPNESTRMHRYNANVLGTQRLFDLSVKYGVPQVLVLSTYFVYGASPYNPAMLTEDAPLKATEITMDLVDSVELENLSNIYLWKHPELNITVLRPCNIVGPGVNNSMSVLLSSARAPVLAGFSPIMQFIHLEDMADAIVLAYEKNKPGIYNVAPDDWVAYQRAVELCGCKKIWVPSIPPALPLAIARRMKWKGFPPYLLQYFKYPVTLNGHLFRDTFDFHPQYTLCEIMTHYRLLKE